MVCVKRMIKNVFLINKSAGYVYCEQKMTFTFVYLHKCRFLKQNIVQQLENFVH